MSRGKHARRRVNRDRAALEGEIATLAAQLVRERDRLDRAQAGVRRADTAQARLAAETAAAARVMAPVEAEVTRAAAGLGEACAALTEAQIELGRCDARLSRIAGRSADPARLRTALNTGVRANLDSVHRSAPLAYHHLAFRRRAGADTPLCRTLEVGGWIPPEVPATDHDRIAAHMASRAGEHSRAALWCWAVPPWMGLPDGTDAAELRAELGATTTGAPDLPHGDFPARPRAHPVVSTPWRHRPLLSLPEDAVDLAYWYRRSAWTQNWHSESRAVPLWLGNEHANGFPRSQPLPAGTDRRLPFPTVIVVFESGWELPARHPDPPDTRAPVEIFYARGRATAAPLLEEPLYRLAPGTRRADLATPLQLVERYGATVEGLIFTADPDGHPADEFAWCLAIHHPWGLPLGRITVPASRWATHWTTAIDNTLAGVCLAHFHPTATSTRIPGTDPRPTDAELSEHDDAGVHVLDIATTSPTTGPHRTTTRSPAGRAAHLRRATWRYQPVGPGRQQRRWTWVRATIVGNRSTPTRSTVYRLTDQ
ncbi:hypothetical protein H7X46_02770 [Pseudonocardia sp. C8]|uniref:hypothetical protein n=1 Tax=Pseudonocardia sp. C8 TaxID=2762759 RepID=UPI0016431F09|nr:hypothetical protein [Pseudonocardia sp. C8]MBC3189985.1 hypothetical protein [Pseudonocardia sp. C8]